MNEDVDRAPIFPPPKGGWICFHCGEALKTVGAAELHFGCVHNATPACKILSAGDFALLHELRNVELQRDEFEVRANAARMGLDLAGEDEAVARFRADRRPLEAPLVAEQREKS